LKILLVGGLGYIGSYLYECLSAAGYEINICDDIKRGNPAGLPCKYPFDYDNLSSRELSSYNVILWFAGHSSVQVSTQDPKGAIGNNMVNLLEFLKKLPSDKIKFIYASTASLYTGESGFSKETARVVPNGNTYDISKFSFDYLSPTYHSNLYGLRMGTLAGYSKNIRPELIFNQMCLSAYFNKKVYIANKSKYRSLLFLSDLAEIVSILLTQADTTPGFYNCASYSFSIEQLASTIANHFNAELIELPNSETYSFQIDVSKIVALGYAPTKSFEEQIDLFSRKIHENEKNLVHMVRGV
jgi:nucleoside-diphosphate-sugar epimerase